jgi:hypothetical protein
MCWGSRSECATFPLGSVYPERLFTRADIARSKATAEDLDICYLPLADYPLLKKFQQAKHVRFYCREGTCATDEKIRALAKLMLPDLMDVNLLNGKLVTDRGIQILATIKSLKWLGIEGTGVTDESLKIMASEMHLTSLSIGNCSGITSAGLYHLKSAAELSEFSFSLGSLTQAEVIDLLEQLKHLKWCQIIDSGRKLDVNALKAHFINRALKIVVQPKGALQNVPVNP